MARDAQLAGDRVQSEYFLQFADHYFRVLGENRSRVDDQRRQHGDDSPDDDEGQEEMVEASNEDRGESDRSEGDSRRKRSSSRERPQRNGAPQEQADSESEDERIAVEVLPPAIGRESDDEDEAAKPRRRARKPRSNDGDAEDIAPAA